jgi:hypothetical protein
LKNACLISSPDLACSKPSSSSGEQISRRSAISDGVEVFVTRRMTWGMSSRDVERSRAAYQLRNPLRKEELTIGRRIEEIP